MQTTHLLPGVAIQPNLELKTRPKQLLGSLPLVISLPGWGFSLFRQRIRHFRVRCEKRRPRNGDAAKRSAPCYGCPTCGPSPPPEKTGSNRFFDAPTESQLIKTLWKRIVLFERMLLRQINRGISEPPKILIDSLFVLLIYVPKNTQLFDFTNGHFDPHHLSSQKMLLLSLL